MFSYLTYILEVHTHLILGFAFVSGVISVSLGYYIVRQMLSDLIGSDLYLVKNFVVIDNATPGVVKMHVSAKAKYCALAVYIVLYALLLVSPLGIQASDTLLIMYSILLGFFASLFLSDILVGFLPTFLLGLIYVFSFSVGYFVLHKPILDLLQESVISGSYLFILSMFYYLIRGAHGFGIGDSLFLMSCGIYIGYLWVLAVIGVASLLMFPYALYVMFRAKKNAAIPFIPALMTSFLMMFMFQPYALRIFYWYLKLIS